MAQTNQKTLQPIEDMIFAGLQQRFTQVFGCLTLFNTAFDKGVTLKQVFEGRTPELPYAVLTPTSQATNTESYSRKAMARHGLYVLNENGITHKVKILPTVFDIDVEYVTDKFSGTDAAVRTFLRRWNMASVQGFMRFGITYGRLQINIGGVAMSDAVTITPRENPTEATTTYNIQTTMQVKGYVSEPMLIQSSTIQDLRIDEKVIGVDGRVEGAEYWSFDELRVTNK